MVELTKGCYSEGDSYGLPANSFDLAHAKDPEYSHKDLQLSNVQKFQANSIFEWPLHSTRHCLQETVRVALS